MLRGVQNYTAENQGDADTWFGELDRQLAAFRAGTETPGWVDELMTDPNVVTMVHSTTTANGYIYCRTEISIPDPE